jgi:hypothetical protein
MQSIYVQSLWKLKSYRKSRHLKRDPNSSTLSTIPPFCFLLISLCLSKITLSYFTSTRTLNSLAPRINYYRPRYATRSKHPTFLARKQPRKNAVNKEEMVQIIKPCRYRANKRMNRSHSYSSGGGNRDGLSQLLPFNVLIIIRFLRSSPTRIPRHFRTVSMVSTTLWKLLAAPRSWVKRAMLSWDRLPCSMTVITSLAKATSFKSRTRDVN